MRIRCQVLLYNITLLVHLVYECRNIFSEKSSVTIDKSNNYVYNRMDKVNAREAANMGINYKRLWKLLIDKEMTKTDLRKMTDIAPSTLSKMGRNEYVSLEVLVRICVVLNCELSDIAEIEKQGD